MIALWAVTAVIPSVLFLTQSLAQPNSGSFRSPPTLRDRWHAWEGWPIFRDSSIGNDQHHHQQQQQLMFAVKINEKT
uniref:Putative secreted peptide n=1 Tax=Anopheles braziliensis TaxID=58242 RepID=A0A2M3ZVN5_9DIPT